MQRVRVVTMRRPCLCTQTLCSWTPATTSSTQIALQPSSRWGSLPRHCKMPSAPASSTASGPRYRNTNPAMYICNYRHVTFCRNVICVHSVRCLPADGQISVVWQIDYYTDGTVMRRLTTAIRSEKCVVRRFRRCVNVIECNYTNLDSTV